jgi:hypothetical protein
MNTQSKIKNQKSKIQNILLCLAVFLSLSPVASRQLTVIRVAPGDDLQAAIDAARPGDTILLAPGARFVGNFVLPAIPEGQSFITLSTDGPDLPPPGVRTGPFYAGRLAILQSPNADAALRTVPGAHHWRLENLEFRANHDGAGNIIDLGGGAAIQTSRADVPHTLVLDRLYITGDPEIGQKRAIALNSANTDVRNSYIAGIRGVGMDTQAIAGWNGPGPYVIENNYLEAAGENIMFGGADPGIRDLVPENITIRRNVLSKPLAWRDPIVAAPTRVRAVGSPMGGSLGSGTYTYKVIAERPSGQGTTAVSTGSADVQVSLQSTSSGSVSVEWSAAMRAAAYRVYRLGPSGWMMWRTTSTRFTDTGAAGTPGDPPDRATVWSVKNLFELKNARNVTFDGNVLERNWLAAQNGYAILLQPTNQDGRAPWSTLENIRIVNNVIRDVSSAVNILGVDQRRESGRVRGITIANNLFANVDKTAWGGTGDFLLIGGGAADVTIESNTILHTGRLIAAFGGSKEPKQMHRFVYRYNVAKHNEYGVKGDGVNSGQATLAQYFPGVAFEGNVLAGGNRSLYPLGNYFPSVVEFETQFVGGGNYRLKPQSPFQGMGADLDRIEAATGISSILPVTGRSGSL